MFEITISSANKNNKDISFLIDKLRPKIKGFKTIIVCESFNGRDNLAIAINDYNKELVLSCIYDAICETIVRVYKEEVLLDVLKHKIQDKIILTSFVKALTMFDKASDKEIIMSKLKPSKIINLDSLYYFRLWELTKRWENIAFLVSENTSYLMMSGAFNDLMRFLISTNEVEFGDIFLSVNNNKILGKDIKGTEVFGFEYNNDDNSNIKVISELISLSPKKIHLSKDFFNLELTKYLEFLYDERITILV